MIPVYNKIICQIRTIVQALGILLWASNEHSKLVEPFIAEQGSSSSFPDKEPAVLLEICSAGSDTKRSDWQFVCCQPYGGREASAQLPTCQWEYCSSPKHVFGVPRALLAAFLCLSLSRGAKCIAAVGGLSPLLTFVFKGLAIFLCLECRRVRVSAFRALWMLQTLVLLLWKVLLARWWSVAAGTLLLITLNVWGAVRGAGI